MHLDPNHTLAELAVSVPAASRVFKRHRLDYCCGGHRPLVEACLQRGLESSLVLAEIASESSTAETPQPAFESCGQLIDHLVVRYHEPLRRELPELVAMAARVEGRHRDKPACPRGLSAHLTTLHGELLEHLAKEERVLFPMIRARNGRLAAGPVTVMQREHDDHGASLAQIRLLTRDLQPPAEACATWRALYLRLGQLETELMDHIHLENNVLFPGALSGALR